MTMLTLCNPYVHKDYDGDPAISMGTAAYLAIKGNCRGCGHSSVYLHAGHIDRFCK